MRVLAHTYLMIMAGAAALLLLALCTGGCAAMPPGPHGELLNIRHGWLEVAQVSERCQYQQREYAARITCNL